ncbi:MAG: Hpt domain-containing protein [Planctomycetaceae bacterium]|jgi:HPt (histidine-containing phosphotransfer) domain-containing protein|nr:Hpt domain-containing protein [Planctomycetaceae bacterium]
MKPIYSSIADEPDMWELVAMFIDEMPERILRFNVLLESDDDDGLLRFAHQFKGSSGSYGFAELSLAAEEIVTAIKDKQPKNKITELTQNLIELCKAASIKPKKS